MSLASVLLSFLLQFLRVNKKEYLKVEKTFEGGKGIEKLAKLLYIWLQDFEICMSKIR